MFDKFSQENLMLFFQVELYFQLDCDNDKQVFEITSY